MVKIVVALIGLLTMGAGLLPVISDNGLLPESLAFIPTIGLSYQAIIVFLGLAGLLYGLRKEHAKIK